jgi:hypothetical protein
MLSSVDYAPFVEIVRAHFDDYAIAHLYIDLVLAQFSAQIGDNLMFVREGDSEHGIGQYFFYTALKP